MLKNKFKYDLIGHWFSNFSEPDSWHEVNYDFCLVPTDVESLPALVEKDKNTGTRLKGFGIMEVPLLFIGDVI